LDIDYRKYQPAELERTGRIYELRSKLRACVRSIRDHVRHDKMRDQIQARHFAASGHESLKRTALVLLIREQRLPIKRTVVSQSDLAGIFISWRHLPPSDVRCGLVMRRIASRDCNSRRALSDRKQLDQRHEVPYEDPACRNLRY